MKCKKCGTEFEGNVCPECGTSAKKPKKPIYKQWWLYVLVVIAVVVVAGVLSTRPKTEKIKWSEMVLGDLLPEPPANRGNIHTNTADTLWVDIDKVSEKQHTDYIDACKEKGFTVDPEVNSVYYDAFNSDGYKLSLSYYDSSKQMGIKLDKPMEMSNIEWPSSKAGAQLPAPKSLFGKFSYEHEDNFFVYIGNTTKDDFNDYVKACSDKGFTVDYDKSDDYYRAGNGNGWKISLEYEGFNIMSVEIETDGETTSSSTAESEVSQTSTENSETDSSEPEESTSSETSQEVGADGLRVDFKEAMDSYEEFMNEYVEFMKKYSADPTNPELTVDYADYMAKYADFAEKMEKWDDEEMNAKEIAYYTEVVARVNQKLRKLQHRHNNTTAPAERRGQCFI